MLGLAAAAKEEQRVTHGASVAAPSRAVVPLDGPMEHALEALAASKYLSLGTYRLDGSLVRTPVWLVRDGDALLVTTQGSSGKVKRIRANPAVLLAPCDARGKLRGAEVAGTAELQGAEDTARTTARIRRRYGLLGWVLTRRGGDDRQGIALRLG